MAEDFRIQVETDLDTSKAEQKLNALLKEKRQIKLDIDINNQNIKNISKNIEKGIKDTKIDTSALTKQLADSFNISDKSVLKNLNKQLNSMVTNLGKTWNGSKFDFGKATGFYSGLDDMAKTLTTNSKLVKSATGYYDDFYNYFKNKKIYVSDDLKKALGGDNYKELLQNNIGKITKDAKKGISVDSLWGEMSNLFPEHFSQNITNQADQIIHVFDLIKKARQDMTQSINFSDLSTNQKFDVTSSAYEQVVTMGKEVADKLKSNIQSATEASKTSIDLDVNVDKEKIASQIKEAIASAGNNAGEAIKLDLQINDEQILSNLRSSISKIASGDEPVKVDIDVDVNGLQEKLNSACHDMEIPVDFKIDSEDIASRIKAAVDGITDIELDLKVNTDSVRQAVDENLKKIEPEVDESGLTQLQQALHNINTAGQQSQSVFSSLGSTFKEAFSAYSLANVMQDMLYKIADGAREAVGTVKELNDSITSLEMATGENYNTVKQMMSQYNEMGQELGSITTDIAEGADSWLRQGKSVQETNQLLKDSMVLSKVWVGSNDFNNNQSQMSSQTGAQNQASNASQTQQTANSKPSGSASGTDTSGIKDNASKNDKITENIMKPENTTNRPVAELTVSKSSVSIEEGKSTSVSTKIRPNDAANKKLSWKSSNTAIATVSNGTISGKKPGSCQVTVSTTDGSGISKTIAVTVTKKPDPPKPAIPSNKGGDGVPRVGDVVTFNGKYYYDSWGKRPAGSLYSGVKNGVVIDSYSSRDYGGSARYTGDLKVHIKSRDGRYGDLGWVRLSQISGYAKGTPGVDRDQIAIVDEEGRELQIPNGKGGRITKLEKGTGVIPHTATEKLMALSEQLDNNGNMIINGRTIEEYVNDMANMQSIAVPDFSDVTASVVSQLEGKGMGNVTVENHYDSLLTVEGNVDKDALPGLEDILKRSYEYTSKQMVKELRKGGMQIRR